MIYKFFNIFFRICLIFLICLVWFRYFVDNFWLSILYTSLTTIILEVGLHYFIVKKDEREFLKKEELLMAEKIAISFCFNSKKSVDYFFKLARQKHSAIKRSKYILIENKVDGDTNQVVLYPFYKMNKFMPQDLIDVLGSLKRVEFCKIVLCVNESSKEVLSLANQMSDKKIVILDKYETFHKLIKPYNFYPEELVELKKNKKHKFQELVAYSLNKKRSKGYFFASIILLFSSFIFRMNLYYVIMSSLLLLLSLISFILPKFNNIKPEEIL